MIYLKISLVNVTKQIILKAKISVPNCVTLYGWVCLSFNCNVYMLFRNKV